MRNQWFNYWECQICPRISQEEKEWYVLMPRNRRLFSRELKSKTLPPLSSSTFNRQGGQSWQQLLHTWPKLKMHSYFAAVVTAVPPAAVGGGWHCSCRLASCHRLQCTVTGLAFYSYLVLPCTLYPELGVSPHCEDMCTLFFARISTFSAKCAFFSGFREIFG